MLGFDARRVKLPTTNTTIPESSGVQLKEGSFTFPGHFKCRVDVNALNELPKKLDICQQGIEALNDLFYEVPADRKEGVLTQKALWENTLERILDIRVFNASSSYTNLANQLLPLRVSLPDTKQYFPIDLAFKREPNNPFAETKYFARELLAIVAAIKVMREEKLFGYPDFYIYPSKEAFTITDSETGARYIAVGISCLAPEEKMDGNNSEQLSILAIRNLIQQRWDARIFRKVAKSNSLNAMLTNLEILAQDVPTWKKIVYGGCYVSGMTALVFAIFSFLMFVSGLLPLNRPVLEEIALYEVSDDGLTKTKIEPGLTTFKSGTSNINLSEIRLIVDANLPGQKEKKGPMLQVIGTYHAPGRLENIISLPITTALDRLYQLNYTAPLKNDDITQEPKPNRIKFDTNVNDVTFRIVGLSEFGRERFILTPKLTDRRAKRPFLNLETVVQKPSWNLEMTPGAISFQSAERGSRTVSTDTIRILADAKQKDKTEELKTVSTESYFTFSYARQGVKMEIHYLDASAKAIATMRFEEFDDGRLKNAPKLGGKSIGTTPTAKPTEDEYTESEGTAEPGEEQPAGEDQYSDEPSQPRQISAKGAAYKQIRDLDVFWFKRHDLLAQLMSKAKIFKEEQLNEIVQIWRNTPGKEIEDVLLEKNISPEQIAPFKQELKAAKDIKEFAKSKEIKYNVVQDLYYRIANPPKGANAIKVVSKDLPRNEARGFLHIALPGIAKPASIPITFHPEEELEFLVENERPAGFAPEINKMDNTRDKVTGLAYPIKIQRSMWGEDPKPFNLPELGELAFSLIENPTIPCVEGFGAFSLGLTLRNDPKNTVHFYNPVSGETCSINDYDRKARGDYHFIAKKENYGKSATSFFETIDASKKEFRFTDAIARETSQLYIVLLTDKNIEDVKLVMQRRGGKKTTILDITAKSKEALKVVQWIPELATAKDISRYTPKDWIQKANVVGPLGAAKYQAIMFAGEQPYNEVSSEVYVSIENPDLANILYQTVDGDWFANIPQSTPGIKALNNPASQLKIQKFGKDKDQREYFKIESQEIGKVKMYQIVPGLKVKPGQAEEKTKIYFYHPVKDKEEVLDVTVSCLPAEKTDWQVTFDEANNTFSISVVNYPRSEMKKLARIMEFLNTCASIYLIHKQHHNEGKACVEDKKWAETVKWALESIGFRMLQTPPEILNPLTETIVNDIQNKNEIGIKKGYEIAREALLLAWSAQAQSLLDHQLELKNLINILEQGKSFKNQNFSIDITLQPTRQYPILVDEPERFIQVKYSIPFDKLLLNKQTEAIVQFHEAYYYNVPSKFEIVPEITQILSEIYPYPDAFPKQDIELESKISMSNTFYNSVLKYSLWEQRVNEFRKPSSKFWVAMLAVTKDIAGEDSKININEVGKLSDAIQTQLRNYFVTPVEIRRVYWQEIKDKVRGAADINRDTVGLQEKDGLLRFVERSMMSQLTVERCWYADFTFIIDQFIFDQCPQHKTIYLKTLRLNKDGDEPESDKIIKIPIFRKESMQLIGTSGADYTVEVWQEPWASGGGGNYNYVTVQGITGFQDWFKIHNSSETKAPKTENRLRIKFYYENSLGQEVELTRPGQGGPPIIDFKVHPAAVLLYEVSGYRVSPDTFRQLARSKEFTVKIPTGSVNWDVKFKFDNGPILVPFSFTVEKKVPPKLFFNHTLLWKQEPAPSQDKRTLEALAETYDIDMLYMDMQSLPMMYFYPYKNLEQICTAVDQDMISGKAMVELLEKCFEYSEQIPNTTKFRWNKEMVDFYKKDMFGDKQLFQYTYNTGHIIKLAVPIPFIKHPEFKGKDHPEFKVTSPKQRTTVIWRITPKNQKDIIRGFPKYILEKELFRNKDPMFSKE